MKELENTDISNDKPSDTNIQVESVKKPVHGKQHQVSSNIYNNSSVDNMKNNKSDIIIPEILGNEGDSKRLIKANPQESIASVIEQSRPPTNEYTVINRSENTNIFDNPIEEGHTGVTGDLVKTKLMKSETLEKSDGMDSSNIKKEDKMVLDKETFNRENKSKIKGEENEHYEKKKVNEVKEGSAKPSESAIDEDKLKNDAKVEEANKEDTKEEDNSVNSDPRVGKCTEEELVKLDQHFSENPASCPAYSCLDEQSLFFSEKIKEMHPNEYEDQQVSELSGLFAACYCRCPMMKCEMKYVMENGSQNCKNATIDYCNSSNSRFVQRCTLAAQQFPKIYDIQADSAGFTSPCQVCNPELYVVALNEQLQTLPGPTSTENTGTSPSRASIFTSAYKVLLITWVTLLLSASIFP